jgi:hypothetical protein
MRGSQSSQPRHIPGDTGLLPHDPFCTMDPESSFPDPSYTLTSIPSEYSSQGHVPDFQWSHPGQGHSPDGDTSLSAHGDYTSSYIASSAMCPDVLSWTSSNAAASIYQSSFEPVDSDYDVLSENMSSSGSDFTSLHTELDQLFGHQFSGAMSSANTFMSHGSQFYRNPDEGVPFLQTNVDTTRRTSVDNVHQTWPQSQQNAGIGPRLPLTPPASDHGTPPTTQECPSLSSQDTCYDGYEFDRYPLSQEGHQTHHATLALTGIVSRNQVHRLAHLQWALRNDSNLAQRHNKEKQCCPETYQISLRQKRQPR